VELFLGGQGPAMVSGQQVRIGLSAALPSGWSGRPKLLPSE
jgi:hypothetical protein